MARTIMTLDKSHIDLIVNGNAFGLTINQIDGDTIKVSGMLENGATFIIDGIDTISTIKAPKEQLPEVEPVEIPVVEKPVTQIELPMEAETKPVIPPKETIPSNVNMTKHRSTRCIMKEKSKEIMDDLPFGLTSQTSIADKYGVSLGTINRFYNKNKEEIEKMRLNKAEENLDAILEDLAKGMPVSVVSNKYSIPQGTIHEVYADNLDKVKNIKISIMNTHTKPHVPEPKKVTYVTDPVVSTVVTKKNEEDSLVTKDSTYIPGKINESFSIDSDTEATIISQLIDDIPIVKIAKDFNIPRERVQKVYFDNKDYICRSREARIRRPKSSMTNDTTASKDALEDLVKNFATR